METRVVKDQALEKQLGGCMAGFFNIFDRPHLLSPKRLSSPLDSGNHKHHSVAGSPPPDQNLPLTLPVMDFKEGSSSSPWRFSKEAPRLSLDSRAVVDAKGTLKPRQIRDESATDGSGSPSVIARLMGLEALPSSAQPLQRSASESRVSRDNRFFDSFNLCNPSIDEKGSTGGGDLAEFNVRSGRAQRYVIRRKSYFDSADFFPEARQCTKMSSTSDLETLKQLLEALRLKGLLHSSNKPQSGVGNRNLVFDEHQSPIKPGMSPFGIRSGRAGARPGVSPSLSPRRERDRDRDRGDRSKGRNISESSRIRRPTLREQQQKRVSPLPWRRPEPVQTNRGGPVGDESFIVPKKGSEEEEEMWNRQGKTLLERCDKLLHSIAEMAATESGESQPSPISVLDDSLYHEESSPSPVMKRSLDFAEEDEWWASSSESEYVYISDILRATDCLPQESDIFSFLEKQQYLKGKCASRAAAQERRLIFDAVQEIVGQRKRLPPWRMVREADKMQVIWSQFQKIRKKRSSTEEEDLVGYVCGVLGRDLSEDRWRDCQVEMSEAVLDIERLLFKDLIGETIRHLAFVNRSDSLRMRRRLLF